MTTMFSITGKTGYAGGYIPRSPAEASTFYDSRMRLDKSAALTEAESVIREAHTRYLHGLGLPEIGDSYSDEEELEWNAFFARSDVQAELERLAEEAERQFAAGETEEGGFAVE